MQEESEQTQGDHVEGDKVVQEHPEPDTGDALPGEDGDATEGGNGNDDEDDGA